MCVCVCVSGDSGHRGSVTLGSAFTLYQQFSLHFSTKAMGLPVATVTTLILPPDWLPPSFTADELQVFPTSIDGCPDPSDIAGLGCLCFTLINEADVSLLLLYCIHLYDFLGFHPTIMYHIDLFKDLFKRKYP